MELFAIFIQGFLTGMALIMVIGSQNAFILRHGIQRNHVFAIATVSILGDVVLITLGVNGLGTLVQHSPILKLIMVIAGSLFLLIYGGSAFYAAWKQQALNIPLTAEPLKSHLYKLILLALGFSVLNPHAWLDAAIILGSIGGQFALANQRHSFTLGAVIASAVWFYTLAFGAWQLAPYLRKPLAWQIINVVVGVMMWGIAGILIYDYWIGI